MKKTVMAFLALIFALFGFGCDDAVYNEHSNVSASEHSYVSEEESKISIEESEISENTVHPEEIYLFLKSEYTVTSIRESYGKTYECVYYFVNGKVGGAKLMTTLPDKETAEEYYELTLEDYPDAVLNGLTVTHYMADDELFYHGYTLEKLKFVLKKSKYEFTVDFDEELFEKEFGTENSK